MMQLLHFVKSEGLVMLEWYLHFLKEFPLLSSAVQVAILGLFGELLAIKIRKGQWQFYKPWQLVAKLAIWALLGVSFKYAFVGFHGFVDAITLNGKTVWFAAALQESSLIRAFSVSLFTNMMFGPMMMLFHRWTDNLIESNEMDWGSMQKAWLTLIWFWIPAHTITFSLAPHWQVTLAAIWAVALGVILGLLAKSK
jgi:hypothetical protein